MASSDWVVSSISKLTPAWLPVGLLVFAGVVPRHPQGVSTWWSGVSSEMHQCVSVTSVPDRHFADIHWATGGGARRYGLAAEDIDDCPVRIKSSEPPNDLRRVHP